jgi:hypothetical protein
MKLANLIVLGALFASVPVHASYSNENTVTYCGTLLSGTAPTEVVTTVQFKGETDLAGTYKFLEDGKPVSGTLVSKDVMKDHQAVLLWNDKYGEGSLAVTFSEDFDSFDGKWGTGSDEPTHSWQGKKCESTAEPGVAS